MISSIYKSLIVLASIAAFNNCGSEQHNSALRDYEREAEASSYGTFEQALIQNLESRPSGDYYFHDRNLHDRYHSDRKNPDNSVRIDYEARIQVKDGKANLVERNAKEVVIEHDAAHGKVDVWIGPETTFGLVDEKSAADTRFGAVGNGREIYNGSPVTPEEASSDSRNEAYGADPSRGAPHNLPMVDTPRTIKVGRSYSSIEALKADVDSASRTFHETYGKSVETGIASREKTKSNAAAAIERMGTAVRSLLKLLPTNAGSDSDEHRQALLAKASPYKDRIDRTRKYADHVASKIGTNPTKMQTDALAGGRAAIDVAELAYKEMDLDRAGVALDVATSLLDLALGLTPGVGVAKDAYEAVLGQSLVTGELLSDNARMLAAVGVMTAGISHYIAGARKVGSVISKVSGILKRERSAEVVVADAVKLVESAKEIGWDASELKTLAKNASEIKRYGPLEAGVLHTIREGSRFVADTFRSESYFEVTLKEPIKVYRVYGGSAGDIGKYWSRVKPTGPLQAQLDAAILPEWGNVATKWTEVTIPTGTKIYEGAASAQYLRTVGSRLELGKLLGGGNQVYINQLIDKSTWLFKSGEF